MTKPLRVRDPYPIPSKDREKIQSWFPRDERLFLMGIDPVRGTMQAVINNLLKGLIDECRALGITSYDRLDDFVAVVNRRSAFTLPSNPPEHKTTGGNDTGGEANMGPKASGVPDLGADSPSRSGKGDRREKGKKGKSTAGKSR